MRDDQATTPQPAGPSDLIDLADALRTLADRAGEADGRPALAELVRIAVDRVPGARWASLTVLRGTRLTTEVASDVLAERADQLQQAAGSGPCVDAVRDDAVHVTGDVAADEVWPQWGRRVHDELGVASVLSQRLTLLEESESVATLTIYSDDRDAFDDQAVGMGLVLSSHASLLVAAMLARGRATNLMRALESNREIGVAMGILMQRHAISREEAFDLLRTASQDTNRKLSAVASDVADTGILTNPRWPVPHVHESPAV